MIASPCINVCKMEGQTGLCTGCLRTLDEITAWAKCDDARRLEILADVARRRLKYEPSTGELCSDSNRHG